MNAKPDMLLRYYNLTKITGTYTNQYNINNKTDRNFRNYLSPGFGKNTKMGYFMPDY